MSKVNWDDYSSIGKPEDEVEVSSATATPEATDSVGINWEDYADIGNSVGLPIEATPEAEVTQPEQPPVEDEYGVGDFASDTGSAFGLGAGALAKGAGKLFDWVGMDDAGEALKSIGQSAVEYYYKGLSDEAKAEMDKEFVTVKEGGKWYNPLDWQRPEDAAGIFAAYLMGVESLPATVVGMGVGGKIGQGLYSVASRTGTMKALQVVADKGARAAASGASATNKLVRAGKRAEKIQKLAGGAAGATGYGIGEALPAAGMAGVQVEEQIMAMDHDDLYKNSSHYREYFDATSGLDMSMDERINDAKQNIADIASSEAGLEAGIWTGILGAPMGVASAPLFNKAVPWAFKGGKVRGALTEGAGEAMQEFAQSGTEQYVSNVAIKEYADETLDVTRDVVNAAVGGAVSGFGMGAAFGAAGTPSKGENQDGVQPDPKLLADAEKMNVFAQRAVAGLVETHGRSLEEAMELVQPVIDQWAQSQKILPAITDLRFIEKYGKERQVGVEEEVVDAPEERTEEGGQETERAAQEPSREGGSTEEPATEEPTAEEPAAEEPVAEEPVAEERAEAPDVGVARSVVETAKEEFKKADEAWQDNLTPENEQKMLEASAARYEAEAELDRAETIRRTTNPPDVIDLKTNEWVTPKAGTVAEGEAKYQERVNKMGDNHPSARAARIRKSLKDQPPVSRETSGETTTEDAGIDKENIESQPPANDARYSLRQRLNEYEKRTESNVTKFVRRGKKELTKEDAQGWANEAVRLVNDWYKNPIPEEAWELDEKGMPTKMVSLPEEAAPAYAELFITNEKVTKEQIQQWAKNRTFKKGSTLEIGRQLAKAAAKNDMQAVADIIQNLPIQEKKSQIKDFNAEFLRALAIKADAPSEVIRSKPETIEYLLRYKAGSQLPLFSLKEGEAGPWVTASNGEGDLYITRHGARAGTPHKTRQSSNDLVLRIDEAQLNKDYTYYLLQYLQKKIASRARGTAQQAIRAGDVDSVLTEYFASQSPRYSIKELARRVKASERMVEYNKERAEKNGHLVKTLMRTDWSAVEAAVDAATAGAVSANEVQDAIIEWMMYGTNSKYFKRWFGKSKTTDYWGEPIRFFHGTGFDITEFSPSRGFVSLTTDPDFASKFADEFRLEANRPTVYPLYVAAEKIFDYRNRKMRRSLVRYLKGINAKDYGSLIQEVKAGKWTALESAPVQKFLTERSYDAFWMMEGGSMNIGVFDPRNIKSAVGNVGTFSRQTTHLSYALKAPGTDDVFYSTIERWVAEKMPPRMPKADFAAAFTTPKALEKKGVKKEEVADMGVMEWVKSLEGDIVTKEQALEFARKARVELREIEIRPDALAIDRSTFDEASAVQQIENIYQFARDLLIDTQADPLVIDSVIDRLKEEGVRALDDVLPASQVAKISKKLDQARLDLWQAEYFAAQQNSNKDRIKVGDTTYEDWTLIKGARPTYREFLMMIPSSEQRPEYKTRHWKDTNVLIHMRLHGQYDSDTGKTTLIIEEIQSDLHQHGYRYGYTPSDLSQQDYDEINEATGKVPKAPLQEAWKMVGLKRMIRYAVENGYDSVSWTTGQHHQERYTLKGSGVERVELETREAGDHTQYRVALFGATDQLYAPQPWVRKHRLGDFITEELIDKLFAKIESGGAAELSGEELWWDAKGMKWFYDSALKKQAAKYIKKWGSKVELRPVAIVNAANDQVTENLWTFDITEQMRESVMQGQPMYSLAPNVAAEISRRIEMAQLRAYIDKHIHADTKPRAALARLNEGVVQGLYSEEILRHSGAVMHVKDRVKMLMEVSERMLGTPITTRTSLSKRVVEQEINRIKREWENPPQVYVWDDWTGLPHHIKMHVASRGYQDRVEGVVDPQDGSVHIVAENIGTMSRLHEVFVEETLGHHGLRSFFGESLIPFLDEVIPVMRDSEGWVRLHTEYEHLQPANKEQRVKQLMSAYGFTKQEAETEFAVEERTKEWVTAEELLAKMDVEQGIWEKFVGWMREFFRRFGLLNGYTENDFRTLMAKVHNHVMNGTTPHAWGKRHKSGVMYAGQVAYSLYGGKDGILLSKLEEAIKKLDPKSKPKNYLIRIKGSKEENWMTYGAPSNLQAVQSLGFSESELQMTGVTDWLNEQHRVAPNKSITRDQILEVFNKTKPKLNVVSRTGHFLFPTIPLAEVIEVVPKAARREFDIASAQENLGYFSDRLTEVLNDPEQKILKELFNAAPDEQVTPSFLWYRGAVNMPFGAGGVPSLDEFKQRGISTEEISQAVGLRNLNAPLTRENSTAEMRGIVADRLVQRAQNKGDEYISYMFKAIVTSPYFPMRGDVKISVAMDDDGLPVAAYRTSSSMQEAFLKPFNEAIDKYRRMKKADQEQYEQATQRALETQSNEPPLTMRGVYQQAPIPSMGEYFTQVLQNMIQEEVNDRLSNNEWETMTPEALFPNFPALGEKIMIGVRGAVSATNKPVFIERSEGSAKSASDYAQYTLQGGQALDVISLQMYGRNQNTGYAHYDREDVVHARVKTRVGPNGEKILGIEEVQSDWASNYRKAHVERAEYYKWADKHAATVVRAAVKLYQSHGIYSHDMTPETVQSWRNWVESESPAAVQIRARMAADRISLSSLLDTGIGSFAAIEALSQVDKTLASELKTAALELKGLKKSFEYMPWVGNYMDLMLSALVGYARQTGFDVVAWPEGSHVARIYGSYMGEEVNGLRINPQQMVVYGSMTGPNEPSNNTAWTEIAGTLRTGQHRVYTADYLGEVIDEGGVNAEVAKAAVEALQAWIDNPDYRNNPVTNQEDQTKTWKYKVETDIGNRYLRVSENGDLLIMLPEERLWNARLHKLLYNRLLPQAARAIAKDTKAMKKRGEVSTGHVYVEDAYNVQWRGRRRDENVDDWANPNDHQDVEMEGRPTQYPEQLEVLMYGRDGGSYRRSLRDWIANTPTRQIQRYSQSDEAVLINEQIVRDMGQHTVELKLDGIIHTHGADYDDINPMVGMFDFSVVGRDGNHSVLIPVGDYNNSPVGARYTDYTQYNDSARAPMLYRMGYQIMKYVWGIENPNPLIISPNTWRRLMEQFRIGLADFEDHGFEVNENWVQFGEEVMKNNWEESKDNFEVEAEERFSQMEPEEYDPVYWGFDYDIYTSLDDGLEDDAPDFERRFSHEFEFGLSQETIDLLKEHGTLKDKGAAAVLLSIMSESPLAMEHADYQAVADLWNELDTPPREIAEKIPPAYIERYGAVELEERQQEQELIPYGIDNPQRSEQVWHAIFINDRVKERDIFVPFSLRNDGNEKARSIVNQKIAKSHSQMTVLDRVTHWTHVVHDKIKTGDLMWGMKQGLLDSAASVERWEREIFGEVQDAAVSPYKMMHMTKNLASVMAAISKAGIPEMRDGVFQPVDGRKGFIEIFRPVYEHPDGDLQELWEGYAAARRSDELLEQTNPDGTDREKLFSREEVDELLQLGEKYPVFKTVFDEWTEFNNQLLDLAVSEGVLSAVERDAWAKNAYVPFYRAMEEIEGVDQRTGMGRTKAGVAGQHPLIKRLRGSKQKLGNITENLWFNTASLIDKVYKNHAMNRVVDMLDGVAMKEIDMPWEAIRVSNSQIAQALKSAGILTGDAEAQVRAMSAEQKMTWNTIFRRVRPTADNVVGVMREGKMRYYEVQDEHLLVTLTGMGAESMVGLMKAMGMSKSLLTRMITIDPGFMLANWLRDTLSAWVTSDANFIPVKDSIAAMGSVFKEDGSFVKMMMSGAGGGGFYDLTGGNVTKVLDEELSKGAHRWLGKAWKGYMKIGAASENSNRLAIANQILKKGGSAAEAMYQAQDIMNFTMSGDYAAIRFLIRTVPFLNARMQGLYRLYRGARDNPVGFTIKGAALMSASLALLAKNWDDDDYEETDEWLKDRDWSFYVNGMHYTIPKPFEVGLLFGTLPERLVRALLGRDDLDVSKDALMRGIGETLAFNPIPQLIKPMYELGANKNLFTGKKIVNLSMSGLEYPYQATPWTSPVAKHIGQAVPEALGPAQSPLRIQHTIRAYTGTVGLYTLNSVDWLVRKMDGDLPPQPTRKWWERPVINRIVKGPTETTRYNKYEDKLYDLIDQSNKAQRTFNMLAKQQRIEEAKKIAAKRKHLINPDINAETGQPRNRDAVTPRTELMKVQKALRDINEAQRAIMNHKTMSSDKKRAMLDKLTARKNKILSNSSNLIEKINQMKP